MISYVEIDGETVETANGHEKIRGVGTLLANMPRWEGDHNVVRLYPVYYVPNFSSRLLSLKHLLKNGCTMFGDEDDIKVYQKGSKTPLIVAHSAGTDELYHVRMFPVNTAKVAFKTMDTVDYDILHRRLGHVAPDVIRHARKHTKDCPEVTIPKEPHLCEGCALGKMPKKHYAPSKRRADHAFELVHSDLKSFPIESYHKYKYMMTLIDDATSHSWIILLRNKNDAIKGFKQFHAMVTTQYGATIKHWRSDGGGEYKSDAFDKLLLDLGIKHEQTPPYTPELNGRAERFNRTIMDKAEAMRHLACFPQSYWEFTVMYALHVYNRTPLRRHDWKTPYELLHGEEPSLKHLRVLGCAAYVHIDKDKRANKLSPKSELMTFIGISENGNWQFMRNTQRTFVSSQALFDESRFPRCDSESTLR